MSVKTYDLENTNRGGYEPHYEMVESLDHDNLPDGGGVWVRAEDSAAELAESEAALMRSTTSLHTVMQQRDDALTRLLEIEAALPHLLDFRLSPMFDAKGTYTQRKSDEWSKRLSDFRAALRPIGEVKS